MPKFLRHAPFFWYKKDLISIAINYAEEIMQDHLAKCLQDGDYLAAANKPETTAACVNDARNKYYLASSQYRVKQ